MNFWDTTLVPTIRNSNRVYRKWKEQGYETEPGKKDNPRINRSSRSSRSNRSNGLGNLIVQEFNRSGRSTVQMKTGRTESLINMKLICWSTSEARAAIQLAKLS